MTDERKDNMELTNKSPYCMRIEAALLACPFVQKGPSLILLNVKSTNKGQLKNVDKSVLGFVVSANEGYL
jgi:hypothetical protein